MNQTRNIFITLIIFLSLNSQLYLKDIIIKDNDNNMKKIIFKKQKDHYVLNKNILSKKLENKLNKPKIELITIFIHGTIIAYPSFKTVIKTLKGDKKSPYKKRSFFHKYTLNQRFNGIYQYQPINKLGLRKIELDKKNHLTSYEISSKKIAQIFEDLNTKDNPNINMSYYTFGWSGRLNSKRRYRWAIELYNELIKIITEIKKDNKHNKKVEIQILAHSHGGNVALNLGDIERKQKKGLKIKNLILFGTPIQERTSNFIYSDIFQKIYSFYSKGDDVQVIDIISSKNFKSHRKFKNNKKKLPSKLVQIEVKCGAIKPKHTELWLLREKYNLLYRRKLSIFPYPVSVYSTEIIRIIDKNFKDTTNIKVNIRKKDVNHFDISFKNFDSNDVKKNFNVEMPFC